MLKNLVQDIAYGIIFYNELTEVRDNITCKPEIQELIKLSGVNSLASLRATAIKQSKTDVLYLIENIENLNESLKIEAAKIEERAELLLQVYGYSYYDEDNSPAANSLVSEYYNTEIVTEDTKVDSDYFEVYSDYYEVLKESVAMSIESVDFDDVRVKEVSNCYILFVKDVAFAVMTEYSTVTQEDLSFLFDGDYTEYYIVDVNEFFEHAMLEDGEIE